MATGVGEIFPAFTVTKVADSTSHELSSIADEGKFLVLDLWTSKCVKCPAALDKLDHIAEKYANIATFVSVALSQGEGNMDIIAELVEE